MAGLLPNFDDEPRGLLGGLRNTMMDPMFLAGAGLLTGQGFGGAMRGAQLGMSFQDQQRQEAERRRKQQGFESLLGQINAPPDVLALARFQGPEAATETIGQWVGPAQEARRLEMELKRAQIAKAQREAKNEGSGIYGTPIYGRDPATGEMVLGAMGKDGSFRRIDTGGVEMSPGVQRVDLGDTIGVLDRSGNLIGRLPKNIAEAKRLEKVGEWEGEAPQRDAGKQRLDTILSGLAQKYVELDRKGAIVSTDKGAMENIRARIGATDVGQALSGAAGAEEQSIRQAINNSRPLLLQSIMQATGMSARALDSNKELEFYLQAVSDPKRDLQSNLAAIDAIDRTFGLGGVLKRSLPPDVYARVATEADGMLAQNPMSSGTGAHPQGGWSIRRLD